MYFICFPNFFLARGRPGYREISYRTSAAYDQKPDEKGPVFKPWQTSGKGLELLYFVQKKHRET